MTELLFRKDPYARTATAKVVEITDEGGIVLNGTLFYPTSGGQPGDSGAFAWDGKTLEIATAVKGEGGTVVHLPAEPGPMPPVGATITQDLNWDRRYRHMRVHTALHLLSVVIPLPVTGGAISTETADLQPCGGTHVANTEEIGTVRIGKIESKGKQNRRVHLWLT